MMGAKTRLFSDVFEGFHTLQGHSRDLHREPVDLSTVVEAFTLEIQPQLAGRRITLHTEGLEGLGQVDPHHNAFHRVLVNLVQNAIDAMPQGGTLTWRGGQEATQAHLEP
jgi:signal transduction histidine kinase